MTLRLGPQVAVRQNAGVANSSAVGLPDLSASSRLIWYIAGSGLAPDDRWSGGVSLAVGVLTATAGSPTLGTSDFCLTSSRSRLVLGWAWPESCVWTSTPQLPALSIVG